MSVAAHTRMTLAEFLEWEGGQETRYEFDGFQPVAMNGVRVAHSLIQVNLLVALDRRLGDGPCRPHGSNLKIELHGRIRYPDAFVSCTPLAPDLTVVRDPVVVFEIISESTARTDRVEKLRDYTASPTIQRYVILEQDAIFALSFHRDGEKWSLALIDGADAVMELPEIGIGVPLSEVYRGVPLP